MEPRHVFGEMHAFGCMYGNQGHALLCPMSLAGAKTRTRPRRRDLSARVSDLSFLFMLLVCERKGQEVMLGAVGMDCRFSYPLSLPPFLFYLSSLLSFLLFFLLSSHDVFFLLLPSVFSCFVLLVIIRLSSVSFRLSSFVFRLSSFVSSSSMRPDSLRFHPHNDLIAKMGAATPVPLSPCYFLVGSRTYEYYCSLC